MKLNLLLSLFPGIGLLDRGFEFFYELFCVVRGPDLIFGGDIRKFYAPPGLFTGIFGGSPCQDFSALRRDAPTGLGDELLLEFGRVVYEGQPRWALIENVPQVPDLEIPGYISKRIPLSDAQCGGITIRIRHFQYFYRAGDTWPRIERRSRHKARGVKYVPCALASGGAHRNGKWDEMLEKQGLPGDFDIPPFKLSEKYRAIGNGVSQRVAKTIAGAIAAMPEPDSGACPTCWGTHLLDFCPFRACACGCDRIVSHPRITGSVTCRKIFERNRKGTSQRTLIYKPDEKEKL